MGRIFPDAQLHHPNHPLIALSFLIACFAATVSIFAPLCGILFSRKSSPSNSKNEAKNANQENASTPPLNDDDAPPVVVAAIPGDTKQQSGDADYLNQPLPPPPSMVAAPTPPIHLRTGSISTKDKLTSSASNAGKVLTNFSTSLINRGASLRTYSRREDNVNENRKLKHDDSLWSKKIILGEKCIVPDTDDDDPILRDGKGNLISTYHPRAPSIISRQSSVNPGSDRTKD